MSRDNWVLKLLTGHTNGARLLRRSVVLVSCSAVVSSLVLSPAPEQRLNSLPKTSVTNAKLAWNEGNVHSHRQKRCGKGTAEDPIGGGNDPSASPPRPSDIGPPQMSAGNSCDPYNGDFTTSLSVFNIGGAGFQPSLTLNYDSVAAQDVADFVHTGGPGVAFGYGWSSQWIQTLDFTYDAASNSCGVIVNQEDGSAVSFEAPATGTAGTYGYCVLGSSPVTNFTTIVPDTASSSSTGTPSGFDPRVHLEWTGSVYQLSYDYAPALGAGNENYRFDQAGRLIAAFDNVGDITTVNYSPSRIVVAGPGGRTLTLSEDSSGHITSAVDSMGHTATFGYNGSGDLISFADPVGNETKFSYASGAHLITSVTDPSGGVSSNTYGTDPLIFPELPAGPTSNLPVISQKDPLGRVTTFCYFTNGAYKDNPSMCPSLQGTPIPNGDFTARTETDVLAPGGDQTLYAYNDALALTSVTTGFNPSATAINSSYGAVWTYNYVSGCVSGSGAADGEPCSVTDPNGHATSFGLDVTGNVVAYKDADGNLWTYSYNDLSELTAINPPAGPATQFVYGSRGQLTGRVVGSCTSGVVSISTYLYADPYLPGFPTSIENPDGQYTNVTYDASGDVTSQTDADGNTTEYRYDANGELTNTIEPNGARSLGAPRSPGSGYNICDDLTRPTVTSITPSQGPSSGGTTVTILGGGFDSLDQVFIGPFAVPLASVTDGQITFVAPPAPAGQYQVVVKGRAGAAQNAPVFTYMPPPPPPPPPTFTSMNPASGSYAGGTQVTITGKNFTSDAAVTFGPILGTVTSVTATSIVAISPTAVLGGSVPVVVTEASGSTSQVVSSGGKTVNLFTYQGNGITDINPTSGPNTGGTQVAFEGPNVASFLQSVDFFDNTDLGVESFECPSANLCVAVSPPLDAWAGTGVIFGFTTYGARVNLGYFTWTAPSISGYGISSCYYYTPPPSAGPPPGGPGVGGIAIGGRTTTAGIGVIQGGRLGIADVQTSSSSPAGTSISHVSFATKPGSSGPILGSPVILPIQRYCPPPPYCPGPNACTYQSPPLSFSGHATRKTRVPVTHATSPNDSPDPITYVVDNGSGVIDPFDAATGASLPPIPVGPSPMAMAVSPDRSVALVADYGSNTVTPVNLAAGIPESPLTVCQHPTGVVFMPNSPMAYVACNSTDSLVPITWPAGTWSVGTPISLGKLAPLALQLSVDASSLYVSGVTNPTTGAGAVAVFSPQTGLVSSSLISVGNYPNAMTLTNDGAKLYVNDYGSNAISVISTAAPSVTSTIQLPYQPFSISLSAEGSTLVSMPINQSGEVYPINIESDTLGTPIPLDPGQAETPPPTFSCPPSGSQPTAPCLPLPSPQPAPPITGCSLAHSTSSHPRTHRAAGVGTATGTNAQTLYWADQGSSALGSFDLVACRAGTSIGVIARPDLVVASKDGKSLYSVDLANGTVSIVDLASGSVTASIYLGATFPGAPDLPIDGGAVLSTDGHTLYVVPGVGSESIIPVDVIGDTVESRIPAGPDPIAIALGPNPNQAWVANATSGSITPVNLATGTDGTPIHVGDNPIGLLVTSPSGHPSQNAFEGHSGTFREGLHASSGTSPLPASTVWVVNYGDGSVVPVNAQTSAVGQPIPVGSGPASISQVATSSAPGLPTHLALVADSRSNQVVPLDLDRGTTLAGIPVSDPIQVVQDADGTVLVSSPASGVSMVSLSSGSIRATIPTAPGALSIAIGDAIASPCSSLARNDAAMGHCVGSHTDGPSSRSEPTSSRNPHFTATPTSAWTTAYSYDADGRLIQVVGAATQKIDSNATTNYSYDANGNLISVVDPSSNSTSASYDSDNEVTSVTTGSGTSASTTHYGYAPDGVVSSETDGAGDTTNYSYLNSAYPSLATAATDPLGNTTAYTYDPGGNLSSVLDPMSRLTSLVYDAANRLTTVGYQGQQQVGHYRGSNGGDQGGKPGAHTTSQSPPCLLPVSLGGHSICSFTMLNGSQTDPPTTWTNVDTSQAPTSIYWGDACLDSNNCVAVGAENTATPSHSPLVTVTHDGGHSWSEQVLPGLGDLSSLSCPSSSFCVAVGGNPGGNGTNPNALIFTSSDGGTTWSPQSPPAGISSPVSAIDCISTATCFAAAQGSILASHDGAATWQIAFSSPVPLNFYPLERMSCPSTTNCVTVALEITPVNSTIIVQPVAVETNDGGATWSLSPMGPAVDLMSSNPIVDWPIAVDCVTASSCVAVGWSVQVGNSASPPTGPPEWTTSDGGATWTASLVPANLTAGEGGGLFGLSCVGSSCLATGAQFTLVSQPGGGVSDVPDAPLLMASSDGGSTWSQQSAPAPSDPSLTSALADVFCLSTTTCFASGAEGSATTSNFNQKAIVVEGTAGTTGPPPNQVTYSYDGAGRRIAMNDSTGTTDYGYNDLGQMSQLLSPVAGSPGVKSSTAFSFDAAGQETCVSYLNESQYACSTFDPAGREVRVTDPAGRSSNFFYDANGNLTRVAYPVIEAGATDLFFSYDGADALTSEAAYSQTATTGVNNLTETFSSNAAGLFSGASTTFDGRPAGSLGFTYDSAERLTGESGIASNALSYAYDSANRLTQMTLGSGTNQVMSYNRDSELCGSGASSFTCPSNPASPSGASRSFTFDPLGDRTGQSGSAASGPSASYGLSYNQAGNLTCVVPGVSSLTGPVCPSNGYSFSYNGDGLRTAETGPSGSTTQFLYNLDASIPQLLSDSTNNYIYGPQGTPLGNAPIEQVSESSSSPTYLLSDPSGVRLTVDNSGLVGAGTQYDAWGNPCGGCSLPTPFGYQGAYSDTTGFQYLINRYYDPSTGQFLSVDPLEAITNQPYVYAADDPASYNDPLGLCGCQGGWHSVVSIFDPWSPCNPIRQSSEHGGWWSRWGQYNPAYQALAGYSNEVQCAESGGSYWSCLKYGGEGVLGVFGTLAFATGIGEFAGFIENPDEWWSIGNRGFHLHYDDMPHPPIGTHLQLDTWLKGVSGSGNSYRFPWPPWQ